MLNLCSCDARVANMYFTTNRRARPGLFPESTAIVLEWRECFFSRRDTGRRGSAARGGHSRSPTIKREAALLVHMLQKMLSAFEAPTTVVAALAWPKFSLSSLLIATRLRRRGIRPTTIIDAGANEGQFAIAMAHVFPDATIHSFEPDPKTYRRLARNVRRYSRVHTHELALGDRRGESQFHVNTDAQVSSLLPASEERKRAFPNARTTGTIVVKTDTLSRFFADLDVAQPVLLKLDVQGYEHRILEGAGGFLPKVDYVLTETAIRPLYVGEVPCGHMTGILENLGFSLDLVADWHHSPRDGTVIELDLLFARGSDREPR